MDLQYQVRTFPEQQQDDAAEHAMASKCNKNGILPRLLRRLCNKVAEAKVLLVSAAIAMRSSHVSDFYATKYMAKPQQWLHSVLGPLIVGFRRAEERSAATTKEKASTYQEALRKVRTAIFAANRCIWISSCEAALFLNTGGAAVFSHADVPVHARRALFMMHECKRMLNKEVSGSGLWEARLPEEDNEQGGLVFEVAAAEHDADEDVPETAMQEQEQHTSVPEASAVSNDDPEEQHEVADVGAAEHMLSRKGPRVLARGRQRRASMLECSCSRSRSQCGTTGSIEGPPYTTWISTRMSRM